MKTMKTPASETRKAVMRIGCSGALMYTLNNEFGHPSPREEKAASPLSGGILQSGNQCGMIWGAVLAAGGQALNEHEDVEKAKEVALLSAAAIVDSYRRRTACVNCRDFTGTDFSRPLQMVRYLLFRTKACFRLAEDWAPEAVAVSREQLRLAVGLLDGEGLNCASHTAALMGAGEREQGMVAGMAGGIGLSGEGCGALGTAVYIKSLRIMERQEGKSPYSHPELKRVLKIFRDHTGTANTCREICQQKFSSPAEHANYIRKGGCKELIESLAKG